MSSRETRDDRDVALFTEALELPEDRRAAFLTDACGADVSLRAHLESLLRAHERTDPSGLDRDVPDEARDEAWFLRGGLQAGDHVERYRLIREIGEGGCGVVFLAEQEVPFRRQVALKVIKPGMDSRSVIARFEAERQALAMMDHPGIAKVFDAGTTDSGRPFFVMELIRGLRITEYCERNHPTIEERLELFTLVAQAVQHAHQKGVIHRDIKPSNILVTVCDDDRPVPVIIDFGIAKAVSPQGLSDSTAFTAVDMVVGTPAYMSPEQAMMTRDDVDTRSDIYSLGALLYELLTGAPPFDMSELLKAGIEETRRVIREKDPVRPSIRLRNLSRERLREIVGPRQGEGAQLIRALAGDLDWITMKALEKDRTRRYETANGMALDVRRFLAGDTVLARPPSALYRLRKTIARNKVVFSGLTVLAVVLVTSLVIIANSLARERHARREVDQALLLAQAEKATAQAEAAKSGQVTRFLEDMLQGVGPSVALGRDTAMLREILDRAAARIEQDLADQPAVRAELQLRIGAVYRDLGFYAQAEAIGRTALATYLGLPGDNRPEIARVKTGIGQDLLALNRLDDAKAVLLEVLATRQELYGERHADVGSTLFDLSRLYYRQGDFEAAEGALRGALTIRESLFGETDEKTVTLLNGLALVLMARQQPFTQVESLQRRVLAARRQSLPAQHPNTATALYNLGETLYRSGQFEEAEKLRREALAMRRSLFGDQHPEVGDSLSGLGAVLVAEGKQGEAESCLREALVIFQGSVGRDHPKSLYTQEVLAEVLIDQGKADEALELMGDVLAQWRARGDREEYIANGLVVVAKALEATDRFEEAETRLREALSLVPVEKGRGLRSVFGAYLALGQVQFRMGKLAEAEQSLREAVALRDRVLNPGNPERVKLLMAFQKVLEAEGKSEEAQAVAADLAGLLAVAETTEVSSVANPEQKATP